MSLEESINNLAAAIREAAASGAALAAVLAPQVSTAEAPPRSPADAADLAPGVPAVTSVVEAKAAASAAMQARAAAGEQLTAAEAVVALDGHANVAKPRGRPRAEAKAEPAKPAEEKPAAVATVAYAEVRERLLDIAAKHGADRMREVLKPFGVARGQELKEGQWAAVLEAAKAVLAGKAPPPVEEDLA